MIAPHLERTLEALADAATRLDLVLVPGFKNSGPEHWQTLWQDLCPAFQRIAQSRWDNPDIELWIDAIRRLLAIRQRPAVLIGHSLGALAAACVADDRHPHVAGVMLVAPPRPERFEAQDRIPLRPLLVPATVVASQNDPLQSFSGAHGWSRTWHAQFVDLGEAGHVNAESGYGRWETGLDLLVRLIGAITAAGR